MFTIEQNKEAHSKVKSGANFPKYVQELKELGITYYDYYVKDGHTHYNGANGFLLTTAPKYPAIAVVISSSIGALQRALLIHQQGQTDFLTFCKDAGNASVEKWTVDMIKMTCVYFDIAGNEMVLEEIPGI